MWHHITFLIIIIFLQSCQSPEVKVEVPKRSASSDSSRRNNILISATADDKIYLYNKEILSSQLDSIVGQEIDKKRNHSKDTVTVVINADTATSYGVVYHIMRLSKKSGAKVVVTVR